MTPRTADKVRRLLLEQRVAVVEARPGYARAIVRGDHGLHEVTETPAGRTCTCSPYRHLCSHQVAVGMVTPPALTEVTS